MKLIDFPAAAKELGIPVGTLNMWTARGFLKCQSLGRRGCKRTFTSLEFEVARRFTILARLLSPGAGPKEPCQIDRAYLSRIALRSAELSATFVVFSPKAGVAYGKGKLTERVAFQAAITWGSAVCCDFEGGQR